jgi:hypothetical protein
MSSQVHLDGGKFAQSDTYQGHYDSFVGTVAAKLQAQGLCPSPQACTRLINDGYALPVDTPVTLPSGETLTLKAGVPVRDYGNSLVVGAIRPQSGRTGLGDVEIGGLYMFYQRYNADLAAGVGFRLPTGSFENVPSSQIPTGRGTLDLGIRFNADYSPMRGVWLSFQNQTEMMVLKGKRKETSLLDDSETLGDDQTFERRGLRHLGFFKAAWGLGNLDQALAPLGVLGEYKYALQPEEYLDGVSQGPRQTGESLLFGALIDGLAYRLPVQVEYDYELPVSGTNEPIAETIQLLTLKAYYKF